MLTPKQTTRILNPAAKFLADIIKENTGNDIFNLLILIYAFILGGVVLIFLSYIQNRKLIKG